MGNATARREGREGSRWFNRRPTPVEVGDWFKENVTLHDEGLDHTEFLPGITLIQSKERSEEVIGWDDNDAPIIQEVRNLVYIPYAKVETRIAYFWRLMELHPDWLGVFDYEMPPGCETRGLPLGFFSMAVKHGEKEVRYVGHSSRVRVLKRDTVEYRDVTETGPDGKLFRRRVIEGEAIYSGVGTKTVPVLGKYEPDHHAVMKAETGAKGRALGMAGMLVLPGSGVATAEDMQEALAPAASAPAPVAPTLPGDKAPEAVNDRDALQAKVTALLAELQADHPEALARFQEWSRDRKFTSIESLTDAQIKGVAKKLERTLDEAKREKPPGPPDPPEVPGDRPVA